VVVVLQRAWPCLGLACAHSNTVAEEEPRRRLQGHDLREGKAGAGFLLDDAGWLRLWLVGPDLCKGHNQSNLLPKDEGVEAEVVEADVDPALARKALDDIAAAVI
jgi:hypothetical protein